MTQNNDPVSLFPKILEVLYFQRPELKSTIQLKMIQNWTLYEGTLEQNRSNDKPHIV